MTVVTSAQESATSASAPSDSPLSVTLRQATAAAHEKAEHSTFMSDMLEGQLTVEAVADYSVQLHAVYEVLEEGVRALGAGKHLQAVADERLERAEKLAADVDHLLGAGWQAQRVLSEETSAYVARVQELIAAQDELGLVAHHYVRYLGDLSGGQVIARRLGELYGIAAEGLSFYDFAEIGKIKPYRDSYRAALDSLVLTEEQAAHVVSEANRAFAANGAVFAGLAAAHDRA